MYRREYPDIPGMFDARFREYNRPNIYREFQASWLISLVGKLIFFSVRHSLRETTLVYKRKKSLRSGTLSLNAQVSGLDI